MKTHPRGLKGKQLTWNIHSQPIPASKTHHQKSIQISIVWLVSFSPNPKAHSLPPSYILSPPLPLHPPLHLFFHQTLQCSPHFMATSISLPSTFHGSWATSLAGEDRVVMLTKSVQTYVHVARPLRSRPRMGNVNEGKGLFAPVVVLARNIIGRKRFNQLRGKAIALHSQVITEFCKTIGADNKQRQGLIRLAKKNGEKLGFLA